MVDKDRFLEYINNNFNIDVISYELISKMVDIYRYNISELIKTLNDCRIDITYEELTEKELLTEETILYDKLYDKMKKWIYNTTEKELEKHYDWYNVIKGDKEDLLNTMYESYCDTYIENEKLEKAINVLVGE